MGLNDFFEFQFLQQALLVVIFLSVVCGLISPLVIARKYAFMGSAVSHSTILGVATGLALFNSEQGIALYATTLFITLVLVSLLAYATYRQRIPNDSMIGLFFSTTMGLGIIIHGLYAKGSGDLLHFLFGNILLIGESDLAISGLLLLMITPAIVVPLKKWIFMTFDEEGALVAGLPVALFHYLFYVILTVVIVSAIKVAGTVLINTLLLVPGVFALKWARNIRQTFTYSVLFSVTGSVLGLVIANWQGLPSGASLAVIQFSLLALGLGLRRLVRAQ